MTGSTDILTFHTNGENPSWIHDWETTKEMLDQGLPFHTTQIRLMDSFPVRHAYKRFLLVDGPNEMLFESDGDYWRVDFTDRPLRKVNRLSRMWRDLCLDAVADGSPEPWSVSVKTWEGSLGIRKASTDPGAVDSWQPGKDRVLTLHAGKSGDMAVHGWLSAEVLIGMGLSFETTQMYAMEDARVKALYDTVRIVEGDGRVVEMRHDGSHWRSYLTGRLISPYNDILGLWEHGEFEQRGASLASGWRREQS